MIPSNEVRRQFIDFFVKKHGHTFVPSSSVVPLDDPTLMFANAGMNQFKDVFLGTGTRVYKRAANTQKCIRAGGKHNDLDDVGKDTYHHTFFEMLGNWSFGDYFKREAIQWAWELLTDIWKLDPTRLHVTVFEGDPEGGVPRDDEAATIWEKDAGVDPSRIHFCSKKDNFWEMGETGPCGPCTEIHIDRTPDRSGASLVNKDSPKVIEIWNLVFIQYNREESGELTPLPAKHVDTGMGFERISAVLQNKESNYDTDIFTPIFQAIQEITGAPDYTGKLDDLKDTAYRVIADHIRMLTFALTDGAEPSNEKRGYVVRSVLRRAERYGRQYLGTTEPFLHRLVPVVVERMGGAFPELTRKPQHVMDVILDEEKSFIRTYQRGIKLFNKVVDQTKRANSKTISGEKAFDLHQSYGFFVDITEQMASEVGMSVDRKQFDELMKKHREISDEGRKKLVISAVRGELPHTDDSAKYRLAPIEATVMGWVKDNEVHREGELAEGVHVALLLDRTNFYAEQGGQVGDVGTIHEEGIDFEVEDTQQLGDGVLHIGVLHEGPLKVGQKVQLVVAGDRRPATMKNHTATHMMNFALREVLGDHVEQKGSLVDEMRTRFDFTHPHPLTRDEIHRIEQVVNDQITRDLPVTPVEMPLQDAQQLPGVRAVFGEKYPDPVRVLLIGAKHPEDATHDMSIEFCGGTHLNHTGEALAFKVIGQEPVSKGVRRITAVSGARALSELTKRSAIADELAEQLNCRPEELPDRVKSLQEELKKVQTQLRKGAAADLASHADKMIAEAEEINGVKLIVGEIPTAPIEQVRTQIDRIRQKTGSALMSFLWENEGKAMVVVALTKDLVDKGLSAGDLIKPIAEVVDGRGGGKKDMAQAGGKDPSKIADAVKKAKELGREKLKMSRE